MILKYIQINLYNFESYIDAESRMVFFFFFGGEGGQTVYSCSLSREENYAVVTPLRKAASYEQR